MKLDSLKILTAIGLIGLQISCGKLNTEPTRLAPSTNESSEKAKATKKSEFLISVAKVEGGQPILGDNPYQVRIVYAKSLMGLSSTAKVTFISQMPEMPDMGKEEVLAEKAEDGSYRASLFYSMAGHWEVLVKIEDNDVQDEYVISISL